MYFSPAFVARSFTAALSAFISFSGAFFVILVTREHYGTHFAITIGAVGSVFGLISVASAGFTIHTLMATAKTFGGLRGHGTDEHGARELRPIVADEIRPALTMTLIVAAVAVVLSILGPRLFGVPAEYFYPYWWPYLVVLLLGPLTAVVAGLTQSAAQDGFGLWVSVLSTTLTLASAMIGMIVGLDAHIALAVIGLTNVGVQLVTVVLRLVRLRRFRIGFGAALGDVLSSVPRRWGVFSPLPQFLTTIDGFVFLLAFTFAISVAAHHSAADGAMVALIVSLLRALIVPTKQLGIVGGRMSRQGLLSPAAVERDDVSPGRARLIDLRVVSFSSAVITTSSGLVVLVLMLTGIIHIHPVLVIVLVTAQVILEPWAGIMFSFLKVAAGPKAGLSAFLLSYLGPGLIGLALIAALDRGDIVTIWCWLFIVRLVFIALTQRAARRWVRGSDEDRSAPNDSRPGKKKPTPWENVSPRGRRPGQ